MESGPNTGFNADPGEPNKSSGGKENAKKFAPWTPDTPPVRRFESSRGNTLLPGHEKRLPLHPIGERPANDTTSSSEYDLSNMLHREHAQPPLRAAEDLGSTATREEQQHLNALFQANEQENSDKDKKDTKAEVAVPRPNDKKAPERTSFQDFVKGHKELADLSEELLAETAILKPVAEVPAAESISDSNHVEIAPRPDLPGIGHPETLPDAGVHDGFENFVRSHTELADLSAEAVPRPVAQESPTDTAFRKLVSREGNPDPGSTTWREGEPGTPPTNEGGSMPPRPPIPPTAEGAAYNTPEEPGPFGEQTPLNPVLAQNPWVEAGDLAQPATLAALTALEAQRELDNLHNKSRDAGLAAAVGILGLGLVLEHFGAKRRWKRQQKQLKAQGKELKQTTRTLTEERLSHEQTRQELRRLSRAHATTNEQLHQVRTHNGPGLTATAEAGLVGALAATELASRAARETEVRQQEAAGMPEAIRMSPQAKRELAHGPGVNPEIPEGVAATVYANTIREEMRHERLRDKTADTGINATVRSRQAGQQNAGIVLPPVMSAASVNSVPVSPAQKQAQQKQSSLLAMRWTWAIIGLIIVAAAAALFR